MYSSLLRNGEKFCDVIQPTGSLQPDEWGAVSLVTAQRVLPLPGDVFELVDRNIRFPLTILKSHVGTHGWNTVCILSTSAASA